MERQIYGNRSIIYLRDSNGTKGEKLLSHESKRRVTISCPLVITEFNSHMEEMDRLDEDIGQYRIAIRRKKCGDRHYGCCHE